MEREDRGGVRKSKEEMMLSVWLVAVAIGTALAAPQDFNFRKSLVVRSSDHPVETSQTLVVHKDFDPEHMTGSGIPVQVRPWTTPEPSCSLAWVMPPGAWAISSPIYSVAHVRWWWSTSAAIRTEGALCLRRPRLCSEMVCDNKQGAASVCL
ncbi:hypothetical protein Pcinc_007473 [Petrolisthes cinctipes]|uniref:Uncharacterized protein n=1 Tax=Petrolisthes cinctipes TaxID=88211 RepID=A0AAE1KXC6_PETCI|nr:hypothetical protein Pcinc_007473 [Petrolisthes cinctipes]